MSEPRRWIEAEGPGRTLVGAMQGDALSEQAKLRMRASLGLAIGVVVAPGVAAQGALAGTSAKGIAGAALAKWIAIAAIGGVAVGGAGVLAKTLSADVRAPIAVTQPSSAPVMSAASASPAPSEPATAQARAAPESAAPLPSSAAPARPRSAPETGSRPPEPRRTDVNGELLLLERARRALRSGDAPGAMAALSRYRASAPRGVLAVEADALEIEALIASGRSVEATVMGRRFLARNGEGPLSDRVRRLLTEP
jgi:hypothetical protein